MIKDLVSRVRMHFSTPSPVRDAQLFLKLMDDPLIANPDQLVPVAQRILEKLEKVEIDDSNQRWIEGLASDLGYAIQEFYWREQGDPVYQPSLSPEDYVSDTFLEKEIPRPGSYVYVRLD